MITPTVNWPDQNHPEPVPETAIGRMNPEQKLAAGKQVEDPWKHRSAGMKCMTCIWFVAKERSVSLGLSNVGRCRRHAPTMGGYPVVYMTDWCGDHRLDENKV